MRRARSSLDAEVGGLRATLDQALTVGRELLNAVDQIRVEQHRAADQLIATREQLAVTQEELKSARLEFLDARRTLMAAVQVAVEDEAATRRTLAAARTAPTYESAWTDPRPLVSVVIPTYTNWRLLEQRSIPSALAQTHDNIEVVVVGDAAPPETAAALDRVADDRVRYENLSIRGPYPDDPSKLWFVAGTGPMNRAMQLARGSWVAFLNDDDEFLPDHVSTLLQHARDTHAEVAYSKMRVIYPDREETADFGSFPPVMGAFGWQLAMQHHALNLFEYELFAEIFDEPGDWHRARRMIRAGVRFSQVDKITCDYYPNHLWNHS